MQYLVEMKLVDSGRSRSPEEGLSFIEQYVLPTLELCRKLQDEKKIVAGGPVSGAIALAMVMRAESIEELDALIERLPIWPLMETTVIPLTSFEGRMVGVRSIGERLKAKLQAA